MTKRDDEEATLRALEALGTFLDETAGAGHKGDAEIDRELRDAGYDPADVRARARAIASRAKAKAKAKAKANGKANGKANANVVPIGARRTRWAYALAAAAVLALVGAYVWKSRPGLPPDVVAPRPSETSLPPERSPPPSPAPEMLGPAKGPCVETAWDAGTANVSIVGLVERIGDAIMLRPGPNAPCDAQGHAVSSIRLRAAPGVDLAALADRAAFVDGTLAAPPRDGSPAVLTVAHARPR